MALFSSLRKLLSGSAEPRTVGRTPSAGSATHPPPAPGGAATAPVSATSVAGPAMRSMEDASAEWLRFSARVFAVDRLRDVPPTAIEQTLMQRLQSQSGAQWADQLPRLPAILPQLMRLVRRDDVSAGELVTLLSRDPSLVGELMRLANSPRYRTGREITDLSSAIMVLGQQGLNQLVMSVSMRPIFKQGKGRHSANAGTLLWDLSERIAFATLRLSNAGDDEFAAYLAGISSQLGLMALLRALDGMPSPLVPPMDREGLHRQLLPLASGWSAQIVQHWGFPARVGEALVPPARRSAEAAVLAQLVHQAQAVALRHLMQPGLQPAQLGDWSLSQQRCYADMAREFGEGRAASGAQA
ncbi:MAG: HDOD domain-containing protein [Burkholderiaceae bacterium]